MNDNRVLDISWEAILKITVAFLGLYVLFLIKDILVWVLFALVISILFNPAINFFERKRVPRTIATIFIYVAAFAILSALFYWTIPIFAFEIQQFTMLFPQYFEKLAPPLRGLGLEAFENFETFTQTIQDWLTRASSSIFGAVVAIFGGIFSTVTIFAIAIFFSIEAKDVKKTIQLLSSQKREEYFLSLWERCQNRTAAWFGTRILSSLFVGLLTYLTLESFGIKYSFVLALFSGVMDIIPVLGPIVAGILVIILVSLDSLTKAFFILIAVLLIQQIEGNILTPFLTKKMVGLPAVLVLISLLIGGELWGVLGAFLAIPLTGMIYEFTRDFLRRRKEEGTEIY
jgi:predicted PurR-regulated permease PerM